MSKLSERCMLVSLSISNWSGMAIDAEVTATTNEEHKASKDAGRYNKRLVASKFFTGISGAHSKARATHRLLTLPWEDDGTRVLATTGYINYQKLMRECKLKAESEVKLFLADSAAYVREAQTRLGDMFNADDYPDADTLKGKFAFDVEIKPLPEAGDFRAQLSNESTKAIIKDIERRTNERLENAMADVFKRIQEMVQKMAERLREYTPSKDGQKAQGIIRDSLVYNIHELAEFLPTLNITGDLRIDELRQQLLNELVEHSPEILRADAKVRAQTIAKADKMLKKLKGYLG